MNIITSCIKAEREFAALCDALQKEWEAAKPLPLLVNGLGGGALPALCTELCRLSNEGGHPVLLLVPDDASARSLSATMTAAGVEALALPSRDFVLHNITASHDTDRERLFVLHAILRGNCRVVVATPAAALQYTMPRERLAALSLSLARGSLIAPATLSDRLTALGYSHVEAVEGTGQFSRRGGIVDIFAAGEEAPVRLEFFGDEIDDMRYFDLLTQRRGEECPSLSLLPAREVLCDEDARAALLRTVQKARAKAEGEAERTYAAEEAALSGGLELRFADKYISLIYNGVKENLLSYLSASGTRATVLLLGTAAVRESLSASLSLSSESMLSLLEGGVLAAAQAHYYGTEAELDAFLETHAPVHINTFAGGVGNMKTAGLFGFRCRGGVSYADRYDLLREDCRHLLEGGYRVLLLTGAKAEAEAIAARLREDNFITAPALPDGDFLTAGRQSGVLYITHVPPDRAPAGFELPAARVAVLSLLPDEHALRRTRTSRPRRKKQAAGERLLSYADLREGDYVVHAVHDIGRFGGMTTMTVDGVTRDYITVQYAGTDKLFLPADRLEMISKYIGTAAEGGAVKLSRLGGTEWHKTTTRARAAAKDMARELIALYAARARRPGYAFSPDDALQRDFEAAFPYEETESQLAAVEDIKRDMEKPVPMDRLLCGDVGYGKTEVALRAAFKAVSDGKQVAILVPTTILALQHYETALTRLRGFPVTVEMLSRFRTPKQTEQILRRVKRGEVDILIGTHKLLGGGVTFRDLGLLIVDEEQRFGVGQKEKLKELAGNVDVLTLTATPIPRTLNMAMSGIRDMSLLDEAPGDRLPVQTYVLEHDELMIGEAIRRELRRGGQVIYLYNRTETMARTAARLSEALPEARIVSAHGKMDKDDLEEIWQALVRGEIDVILCTTIVETGVDLPNANTLIIEDADRLGLSQLHQLRGRVGRAGRQAYAYFTYRPGKALSDIATRRLSAIREYAAFGAGFQIALRDLEIRGAGNLLGAEQHGHIEAIGYDLYVRLLNEAILEEQGQPAQVQTVDAQIDIRANAHIPTAYIPSAAGRMELYKKISAITEQADMQDIAEECRDRYGKLPREVERLLYVSLARALAAQNGIPKVEQRGGDLVFILREVNLANWSVLFAERKNLKFSKTAPPCVYYRLATGEEPTKAAADFLLRYHEVAKEQGE
ncbi:MAG: transcription-repair coupling factor [Clostridia bacterium]|nr:transcription-repair coupling factor [Clostridia bacterium]